MTVIPIVIGALGTVTIGLLKSTGGIGNKRMSRDHPNCSIVKIGQNTEKSLGDLRRLVVTLTSVENHLLTTVVEKISNE